MSEQDLQRYLCELLYQAANATDEGQIDVPAELGDPADGLDAVRTYAEAGILSSDAGLVLRMRDGAEFQVTLVRSR